MNMNTLKIIGNNLQKINNAKLIDDLERQQELADLKLLEEEEEGRVLCRKAIAACMQTILKHLEVFLEYNSQATYEDWIMKLHFDNTDDHRHEKVELIDHRFYVEESDHRIIWNKNMDTLSKGSKNQDFHLSRKVKAKFKHGAP